VRWRKLGLVFAPPTELPWVRTHAQLPFAEPIEDGRHRIHFSSRDELGRARIGSVVVDLETPSQLLELRKSPEIELGPLGAFDDRGVTSSCIVDYQGAKYQYYRHWPGDQ
jgi:hypothetical protein